MIQRGHTHGKRRIGIDRGGCGNTERDRGTRAYTDIRIPGYASGHGVRGRDAPRPNRTQGHAWDKVLSCISGCKRVIGRNRAVGIGAGKMNGSAVGPRLIAPLIQSRHRDTKALSRCGTGWSRDCECHHRLGRSCGRRTRRRRGSGGGRRRGRRGCIGRGKRRGGCGRGGKGRRSCVRGREGRRGCKRGSHGRGGGVSGAGRGRCRVRRGPSST